MRKKEQQVNLLAMRIAFLPCFLNYMSPQENKSTTQFVNCTSTTYQLHDDRYIAFTSL